MNTTELFQLIFEKDTRYSYYITLDIASLSFFLPHSLTDSLTLTLQSRLEE